jgi:hypothetical protein
MSAVRLTDGSIGLVTRTNQFCGLTEEGHARVVNEMEHQKWTIQENPFQVSQVDIVASLLFLPVLRKPRTSGVFTVIDSRWQEHREGAFRTPINLGPRDSSIVEL